MKIPLKTQTKHTLIIIISAFAFIIFMGIILRLVQIDFFINFPTQKYDYKVVYGNNGSASCKAYCEGVGGGPWNGELPRKWNGAQCLDTIGGGNCYNIKGSSTRCICTPSGTGWSQKGWRQW